MPKSESFENLIDEYEEEIQKLIKRISQLRATLPSLRGEDIASTNKKIKIMEDMIDELIKNQARMKSYLAT